MHESEKARRYEARTPGTGIPVEQKAERYDRKRALETYGIPSKRRRTLVGSIRLPDSSAWCDGCGKFKHEGQCES